jgi:hypothetical protein
MHRPLCIVALLLIAQAAYAADVPDSSLKAGDASITVRFSEEVPQAFRTLVENWVHDAADAAMTVYGRYPVKQVLIKVEVGGGGRGGVSSGRTFDGRLIRVRVAPDVTKATLRSDWILTHEMFHLGFPDTEANWIGEGLSTYLEPLARARAGQLGADAVWGSMMDGFPKGLPAAGDLGLDKTPTWGRTYWGGALFWLLADIEIRQKSDHRKSLDDVLRSINAEGGTGSANWPEEKIFRRGDAAIGMPILEKLHERLGAHPETTDLAALWAQLGVGRKGGTVVFNDDAPLAAIRRELTSGKAGH